jgi:hypothetical protein
MCPAPVRTPACAATRRSPALTRLRVDGSWVSPSPGVLRRPGRGAGPVPGNLVRSESASGTWWRVSAGLLHFPAGIAARWRHQAHRIIEAGPGASSAAAARWPAPGARASRARTRVFVSGKRPNEGSGFRRFRVLARRSRRVAGGGWLPRAWDRTGTGASRRSGRLCRRRGGLCMRRRWGRSVRCGPDHWSVAGLLGPARNSGVSGQNSRSVPRGGHRHPVLLQVLHARIDMGTVRRQRSQTQSGAIARATGSSRSLGDLVIL